MIPPLDVADITRQAADYDYDPSIKLQYWLRTAASLVKEAVIYEREGNDQQAYLLLFRHAQLVLANLLIHPQAKEPGYKRALSEAQREVQRSLRRLEVLKPRIKARFNEYQEFRKRESRQSAAPRPEPQISTRHAPEFHDPAIAGRELPLAAAENKDLAVNIAKKELRRRAAVKSGYYSSEEYQLRNGQEPVPFTQDHYNRTDGEDIVRRLQEIRARIDREQFNGGTRPIQLDGGTQQSRQATNYRYPAIPSQSNFSIPERVSSLVKSELHPSLPPQPPPLPAKDPEPPAETFQNGYLSPPPIPDKVTPEAIAELDSTSPSSPSLDLQPSTFTFKPSSYLENGNPLRTIFISPDLRKRFLEIAHNNTLNNLETCGILCGSLISNAFFISKLLIPEQESTSDTCEMVNEGAVFEYCDAEDLMVLGWIHTHPTQTCFMSSRDLHTQSGYQVMLAESIAIVCAPSKTPDWGVFRLTDPPGLKTVLACTQKGLFHPHGEMDIYTDALRPGHVFEARGLEFETVDLRKR